MAIEEAFREIKSNLTGTHMKKGEEGLRVTIIIPPDCKEFLLRKAERHWTSMNAEAIKLIQAAMAAEQRAGA
jgi:hypothetical protein